MDTKAQRQLAAQKYTTARYNLLVMICFTILNIVLLFTPANVMMLFSATVPYYAVAFGMGDPTKIFLIIGILVAAIILIIYFLCWLLSKRGYIWMIIALALFALDSVALIGLCIMLDNFSGILDILIHGLVLYYLINGVRSGIQLKKLPKEHCVATSSTAKAVSLPQRGR